MDIHESYLSFAHDYDNFFDPGYLLDDMHYFHYYIPPEKSSRKIKLKTFDSSTTTTIIDYNNDDNNDNPNFLTKIFLLEEIKLDNQCSKDLLTTSLNQPNESLLEIPIDRLMKELIESNISHQTITNTNMANNLISSSIDHISSSTTYNGNNKGNTNNKGDINMNNNNINEKDIINNEESTIKKNNLLWTDKYMPKNFIDLLSDDKVNREVLTWLKSWDSIVFKKQHASSTLKTSSSSYTSKQHKDLHMVGYNTTKDNNPDQSKTNINPYQKKPAYLYDITDKHSTDILQNKLILLAGPPGSGKTTLARILAKHAGYKSIEVNASDDRTAKTLIEKLESITQTENITKNTQTYKPTLVILDEVDGTVESENKGTIKKVLSYIYSGKKETEEKGKEFEKDKIKKKEKNSSDLNPKELNTNIEQSSSTVDNQRTDKKRIQIKRPIIFICNDPYAKGLKELRKMALVFMFKKPETNKLMKRLNEICKMEKLLIDHDTLSKICVQCDNDIRSCLNTLEFLHRKREKNIKSNLNSNEDIFNMQKEHSKGYFELITDILQLEKADKNITYGLKKFNITHYAMSTLQRNMDFSLLSEGLFSNFYKTKNAEKNMALGSCFLDSLGKCDIIQKSIMRYQVFEMTRYTMLCAMNAYMNLASTDKLKITYPINIIEHKKFKKDVEHIHETICEHIRPQILPFFKLNSFISDYASFIYQIIQPQLLNVILTDIEKRDLESTIYIMLDFGLILANTVLKIYDRDNKNFVDSHYIPHIEKILFYNGTKLNQRFNDKLKALINNNYDYVKHIRESAINKENKGDNITPNKDTKTFNVIQPIKSILALEINDNMPSKKRKERPIDEIKSEFVYKFLEGYSNAVKYDLKLKYFLKK